MVKLKYLGQKISQKSNFYLRLAEAAEKGYQVKMAEKMTKQGLV